jgi:hypothetical protein
MLTNLELRSPVAFSYNAAGNFQWNAAMNHITGSCIASIVAAFSESGIASLNDVGCFTRFAARRDLLLNLHHTL